MLDVVSCVPILAVGALRPSHTRDVSELICSAQKYSPAYFSADGWENKNMAPRQKNPNINGAEISEVRAAASKYLTAADHRALDGAAGQKDSVQKLLSSLDMELAHSIMEPTKIIKHPLNALGLHAFRAVLVKRMQEAFMTRPKGPFYRDYNISYFYDELVHEGITVVPNVQKLAAQPNGLLQVRGGMFSRLLRAISGYPTAERDVGAGLSGFLTLKHSPTEIQYYMHQDTFMPTWKVWVFRACYFALEHAINGLARAIYPDPIPHASAAGQLQQRSKSKWHLNTNYVASIPQLTQPATNHSLAPQWSFLHCSWFAFVDRRQNPLAGQQNTPHVEGGRCGALLWRLFRPVC